MTCTGSKTITCSGLETLAHYLQVQLFDFCCRKNGFNSNVFITECIQPLSKETVFGVVVRINTYSSLRKIVSLLLASIRTWNLSLKLKRQGYDIVGRFGVYPSIEEPTIIYELNTQAEAYCNAYILPVFPQGLNGRVRRVVMRLIKCHPSTAGIILIARKK